MKSDLLHGVLFVLPWLIWGAIVWIVLHATIYAWFQNLTLSLPN